MVSKVKFFTLILGTLLFSQAAMAKVFIEPHLGFNVQASSSDPDSNYSGAEYGARIGYFQKQLGFNVGLDFTRSTFDIKVTGGGTMEGFTRNEFGGFIGYNFANQWRGIIAYYFSNKSEQEDGNYYAGHTVELTAGYQVNDWLSLNGSYRMVTFDEARSSGQVTNLDKDLKYNEIVLGVSFPYQL